MTGVNLFQFIPGYETHVYEPGKEPLLFLFISFLITFALVRLYTRMARTRVWGSGNVGGVHMHHMVPGVILMVVCGILGFSTVTDLEIAYSLVAIGFGAGAALTLDEFAMLFHLKDVYWAEEGRTSVDALLMGVALGGLLLVVSSPFGISDAAQQEEGKTGFFTIVAVNIIFAAITFLKKKPLIGTMAVLIPFVGLVGAIRLAKPASPWAHWFYDADRGRPRFRARRERRLARATWRYTQGRSGRFERWFSDLVGGAPTLPSSADADDH
jgi:hypothetical protein